jgi:multicomponent Na+:H+ antiporter subunit G
MFLGAAFIAIAAVGVVRMPDLFTRMQAASKAATIGTALLVTGVAVYLGGTGAAVRAAVIALFLLITAPVAAHVIARAGYRVGHRMADPRAPDALATPRERRRAGARASRFEDGRGLAP